MIANATQARMIEVGLIQTTEQVRKRNGFDQKGLAELAESIKNLGVLQPIIVCEVQGQSQPYLVIAGHRRFAATKLAGLTEIPAMVRSDVQTGDVAATMQLVENIQREQLNLADTADAVRALLSVHETPAGVAKVLGKSKSWVSKHLSLTGARFNDDVRALLDNGFTEDLELLCVLNQIAQQPAGRDVLPRLLKDVIANDAGREKARRVLNDLKNPAETAPDDEGEDEASEAEGAETLFSFALQFKADQYERIEQLGGGRWVRKVVMAALKKEAAK